MGNFYKNIDFKRPKAQGLYDPSFEHDSCGVGLVANTKGVKSHEIVQQGLEVLVNLGHRGAVGADPETGDGAGILLQMPDEFFRKQSKVINVNLPEVGNYAVGMTFLPSNNDARVGCEKIIKDVVDKNHQEFLGWRDVPVNKSAVGILANNVMPEIRQFFIGVNKTKKDNLAFERRLYIIRKQIEYLVSKNITTDRSDFYIASLSSNTIVYKGLLRTNQLQNFYQDIGDSSITSSFAMVHSRFSTNTLGSWELAHPYRHVVHNGEINTLRGNINWMNARESALESEYFGDEIKHLKPIIPTNQSDTASFDNVLELLLQSGRSLPHAMLMMMPEAWSEKVKMDKKKKDFYEYHSALMEPWDGPALIVGTDGKKVCAILDRNGLRPCRYLVTKNDLLVMGSESGVLDIPEKDILYKWRIQPGKLFMLDTEIGRIVNDDEIKEQLINKNNYGSWIDQNTVDIEKISKDHQYSNKVVKNIYQNQAAFGFTKEELRLIIEPMVINGTEAIGSMGNDASLAVLSDQNPRLFNYFKQLFAQVSNPPLDAIREELVTSTEMMVGPQLNLMKETPEHCKQIKIYEPILTNKQLDSIRRFESKGFSTKTINMLFDPYTEGSLQSSLDRILDEAQQAVYEGYNTIILSDRDVDKDNAAIPSLLAVSSVHHHLIKNGLRTRVGLIVETGEPRDVSQFSLLLGYGVSAINPWLIFETISDIANSQDSKLTSYEEGEYNYIKSVHKGVVKVMSKMGISTLQGYMGAQVFEAVGLSQEFVNKYFTATPSRINGIGIKEVETEYSYWHKLAYAKQNGFSKMDIVEGGQYQWRINGEYHMWNPETIAKLQKAARDNDSKLFKDFTNTADSYSKRMCTIRGLLEFKANPNTIPIDEVETADSIVKRFATGAISLGSISKEAHETLAIAMNRIGARSNTGEGGEDSARYKPDNNGNSRNSAIKQVASGRFGVSINYLSKATDLQIKMAQGSKPGEGGQLPGHKVDEYIGMVRNSTPGVELISPPPHHDIYSIEDLAQLIYDLKNSNPQARIHVKLVSEVGVGTIAAGVSKARADVVLISGDSGGTGASPESSIKNAGVPWELGLAETQQVLVLNDLRGRIVVQTDGQLKTGRDVAIACLLGAEEFGLATAPLVVMGCIMLRKCHLNTCSVGVATQDPELRKKFAGKPEDVINYFFLIAEQLREIMSQLGFRTVNEMVGRSDMLDVNKAVGHWKAKDLDLSALLHVPDVSDAVAKHNIKEQNHQLDDVMDHQIISMTKHSRENETKISLERPIKNYNRSVGAMLSNQIAKQYGDAGMKEDTISIKFHGSAGQSFGAFLSHGVTMILKGDANDYFCKGLSGGKVILLPESPIIFDPEKNIIVGNVALYGATAGEVYIYGIAGERFAVRNSGATAVVEGLGDHGCEYMTKGTVVVLGDTGRNFGAGMSGGLAYVFDEADDFQNRCNKEMVDVEKVQSTEDVKELFSLIKKHDLYTQSRKASRILANWEQEVNKFVKVIPKQYKKILLEKKKIEIK